MLTWEPIRIVGGFCMNTRMPVTVSSCGRSFSMMSPTSSLRSLRGFNVTTICPRFGPPSVIEALPPMVDTSPSTFGSCRMMSATWSWYSTNLPYAVPCAASVVTEIWDAS